MKPLTAPARGHDGALLALLVLAFILLRLLIASSTVISFDDEDGFNITAAWEMLKPASTLTYPMFQMSDAEGGSLITALLLVPLVLLLGPSLFALHLVGLLYSTAALLGLYLVCRRAFSAAVARLACLLYIFFPGPLLHYSVTAHGFHPDSVTFQLFFIWLLLLALERGRPALTFMAGLLGGACTYFAYISALTVLPFAAIFSLQMVRRRGIWRGLMPVGVLVAGLAVGVLPLVIYNLLNN